MENIYIYLKSGRLCSHIEGRKKYAISGAIYDMTLHFTDKPHTGEY